MPFHTHPFVTIENLSFGYGQSSVIDSLSLSLQAGEIVSLIGSSGSGKTTLLKLLSGLLSTEKGSIAVGSIPLPDAKNQTALMMQQDLLLPWKTVLKNTTLAAEIQQGSSVALDEEARQLLQELGLHSSTDLFPDALSGGMRHRVSLARMLLMRRSLLLLDEPFASLDVLLREQLYRLIRQVAHQQGVTVLLVTHDFRDALILSDRILCLSSGKIKREWKVPSELQNNPLQLGEWQMLLRNSLEKI